MKKINLCICASLCHSAASAWKRLIDIVWLIEWLSWLMHGCGINVALAGALTYYTLVFCISWTQVKPLSSSEIDCHYWNGLTHCEWASWHKIMLYIFSIENVYCDRNKMKLTLTQHSDEYLIHVSVPHACCLRRSLFTHRTHQKDQFNGQPKINLEHLHKSATQYNNMYLKIARPPMASIANKWINIIRW